MVPASLGSEILVDSDDLLAIPLHEVRQVEVASPRSRHHCYERMAIEIVGSEELGSLQAFLDHARRGPATLEPQGLASPHACPRWCSLSVPSFTVSRWAASPEQERLGRFRSGS
jgi:hypothetical protein